MSESQIDHLWGIDVCAPCVTRVSGKGRNQDRTEESKQDQTEMTLKERRVVHFRTNPLALGRGPVRPASAVARRAGCLEGTKR